MPQVIIIKWRKVTWKRRQASWPYKSPIASNNKKIHWINAFFDLYKHFSPNIIS